MEAVTGLTVPELFARDGEAAFRQAEAEVLARGVRRRGAVRRLRRRRSGAEPRQPRLIRASGTVVWLRARPEKLADRVGDGVGRPLLGDDPAAAMVRLDRRRAPLYAEVADAVIDVDDLSPDEVAERVLAAVAEPDRRRDTDAESA